MGSLESGNGDFTKGFEEIQGVRNSSTRESAVPSTE